MSNNFIRVVYSYNYPVQPSHTISTIERTDAEIFIIADIRPPLPALKKMVELHGKNEPGAHKFMVLGWDNVAADEVTLFDVIVNYDDEKVEEA